MSGEPELCEGCGHELFSDSEKIIITDLVVCKECAEKDKIYSAEQPVHLITGTLGWVQGIGEVFIPEKRFNSCPEKHYSRLIHGSAYTIAIFNESNQCVGWYESEPFSPQAGQKNA